MQSNSFAFQKITLTGKGRGGKEGTEKFDVRNHLYKLQRLPEKILVFCKIIQCDMETLAFLLVSEMY